MPLVLPKEVIYISKDYAQGLHDANHLISIRTPGDPKLELFGFDLDLNKDMQSIKDDDGVERLVTHVAVRSDISYAVDDDMAEGIVQAALYAARREEGIVVNCEYGRVRSFTVANWIVDRLGYALSTFRWAVIPERCTKDNGLYRALDEAHQRIQQKGASNA